MKLSIDIYEARDKKPILRHVFFGRSRAAIMGVVRAHMKSDRFFGAAIRGKKFQGLTLRYKHRWTR